MKIIHFLKYFYIDQINHSVKDLKCTDKSEYTGLEQV